MVPGGLPAPTGEIDRVRTSNGAELHAVVAGGRSTVVLSHGALMSLETWGPMWQPLLAAGHRAVLDFDFRERLGEIALPALVARGTRDTAVKAEDAAVLATGMPDAQLIELRNAGHLVVLERAPELVAAIGAFVARSPVVGSPPPPA